MNNKTDLNKINHIHFIGVGGIGVSRLAKYFAILGKKVSGSDLKETVVFDDLKQQGVQLFVGHNPKNISDSCELVIYSSAVREENPEREAAKTKNIPQLSHFEAIDLISHNRQTIAVSGTHGKSTVTAMIGAVLEEGGLDPTVFVGSRVPKWNGNIRIGKSDIFVVEADEYNRQFLSLSPKIAVINNVERDHLDYYKNLNEITDAFQKFLNKVPTTGAIIYNIDDVIADNITQRASNEDNLGYGEKGKYVKLVSVKQKEGEQEVEIKVGKNIFKYVLKVPGRHNVYNSLAAVAVGLKFNLDFSVIQKALTNYNGIWRRFEHLGKIENAEIISDYGHHPTAITETMNAAKTWFPNKKILLVYQPHQRARTKILFLDFVQSFLHAAPDGLLLVEIFDVSGREDEKNKISSLDLLQEISKQIPEAEYAATLEEAKSKILNKVKSFDVVIIMGAGDIYKVAEDIAKTNG